MLFTQDLLCVSPVFEKVVSPKEDVGSELTVGVNPLLVKFELGLASRLSSLWRPKKSRVRPVVVAAVVVSP